MPDLDVVDSFLRDDHGLAVVSTGQLDGRVLSSVVNAGVIAHPISGERVVAFVSAGGAARLAHIRRGSEVTLVARQGWWWAGLTGPATLIGPDDPVPEFDTDQIRLLLRDVFVAAGGAHDDWDEYDRVMAAGRRTAVFVQPARIIGNH